MLETALNLGIRYFDLALSYGMGTAEEVLDAVFGNSRDVVVANYYVWIIQGRRGRSRSIRPLTFWPGLSEESQALQP